MQQDEVQVGKPIVINHPGQQWHGASGKIHRQDAAMVKSGVCIVLLDAPINVGGQTAQALSLPLSTLEPGQITNRTVAEGGVPVEVTLTFTVEYNVNPAFYRIEDPKELLAEEIRALRRDPQFAMSQPSAVLAVNGRLVDFEDEAPVEEPKIGVVDLDALEDQA